MINHVLFILLCRRVCEILLFLSNVKMTKCQRDGEDMTKCHSPLILSLLTPFMMLLCFTSTDRLISLAHATNQYHRNDTLASNSCNLSCMYFLKSQLESRPYVIIGKILDGQPA